jgi:hypothetical protein
MVALVATIHDFLGGAERAGWQKKAWMVGTGADHDGRLRHRQDATWWAPRLAKP